MVALCSDAPKHTRTMAHAVTLDAVTVVRSRGRLDDSGGVVVIPAATLRGAEDVDGPSSAALVVAAGRQTVKAYAASAADRLSWLYAVEVCRRVGGDVARYSEGAMVWGGGWWR